MQPVLSQMKALDLLPDEDDAGGGGSSGGGSGGNGSKPGPGSASKVGVRGRRT
jgi:hypothetical protein